MRLLLPILATLLIAASASAAELTGPADELRFINAKIRILQAVEADGDTPQALYLDRLDTRYTPDEPACPLRLVLYNNATEGTVESLVITLTAHDRNGEKIAVRDMRFRYVDPGRFDVAGDTVPASCRRVRSLRLRAVPVCVIGRTAYSDCLSVLPPTLEFPWVDEFGD
jgi:hypothetical protein